MENSCFYEIRCLGGPESSKSAIWDGKQLFLLNQVFKRSTELKIGYFRWKTAVDIKSGVFRNFPISFSCKKSKMATFEKYTFIARKGLFYIKNITKHHFKAYFRSAKTSKSAILDGKKLTLSNQVFRRSRELKIGYFRWKTAVCKKSGVWEVQSAQNRLL